VVDGARRSHYQFQSGGNTNRSKKDQTMAPEEVFREEEFRNKMLQELRDISVALVSIGETLKTFVAEKKNKTE
jgi:hypothetical protein